MTHCNLSTDWKYTCHHQTQTQTHTHTHTHTHTRKAMNLQTTYPILIESPITRQRLVVLSVGSSLGPGLQMRYAGIEKSSIAWEVHGRQRHPRRRNAARTKCVVKATMTLFQLMKWGQVMVTCPTAKGRHAICKRLNNLVLYFVRQY